MLPLRVQVFLVVGAAMASAQVPRPTYPQQTLLGGPVNPGLRTRPFCNSACIKLYLPVCGSDGKTYSNRCVLDYYSCLYGNFTYAYPGVCGNQQQCPTSCTFIKDPVCGSDGKTYGNECLLRMESCAGSGITKVRDGPCWWRDQKQCSKTCPYLYSPLCGSNGVTYPNICILEIATCKDLSITLQHAGECGQ